jgi:HlyD family type I secretion membrane fusion protein
VVPGLKNFFLPDVEVEHSDNPARIVRAGLAVIAVLVVVVGGFMTFAPLSGAVVAPAYVRVDTFRKTVQHQEGGIVRQILVREGQKVAAGEPVVVLGDVRVNAAYDSLRTALDGELAREARLQAERAFAPAVRFPAELTERLKDPRVAEFVARETGLFNTRRATLKSQVELLRSQVAETRAEIAATEAEIKSDETAIALAREEAAAAEQLITQGFITRTRLLTVQRTVADYESRRNENRAELAKARQRVAELELRILGQRNAYTQQAADELKEATAKVFDLRERFRASADVAERQTVTAPVAGTVVDLKVTTVGAVVGPREPLMDVLPENPDLIVEARVRPEDMNNVKVGAEADVRLTAFKQRLTPVVSGKVTLISADRLTDRASGTSFYSVHVRLDPASLAEAGNLKVSAGMPAEVYVKTVARTPLLYLLDPVMGYLRRSMREP